MYEIQTDRRERAILVGVLTPGDTRFDADDSLNELELLADTAGADVTDRVTQRVAAAHPATYIGKGKVDEVRAMVAERKTDLVIFDDDLSAIQLRNLERTLECKLVDRSALILDIFARNARTATAKTQVELAQLEYLSTRLTRQWTHLSRQKGGIGTKGPGETQIETDRRLIGQRISTLKDRLDKIDRQRTTQRQGREEFTRVSLVGYTNAGKSTLMNALACDAEVLAENRLFATLDATTRTVQLTTNKTILLSDTVGFIRKLPHRLIESFKSTLDEVREADALMHVIDATHPGFRDHMRVVNETLAELDADTTPQLFVFNKVDALQDLDVLSELTREFPDGAFVSARRGMGLVELADKLIGVIEEDFEDRVVLLPVSDQSAISHIHRIADVKDEAWLYASRPWEDEVIAVARLHFRVAPRHVDDLDDLVTKYRDLQVVEGVTGGAPAGKDGNPVERGGRTAEKSA